MLPDEQHQQYVMDIIYKNIKQGQPADMEKFQEAAAHLRENGAQVLILGCTELSLVNGCDSPGSGFLDAIAVLARSSVLACGRKLKETYHNLIS